jgi:hypothetical protein
MPQKIFLDIETQPPAVAPADYIIASLKKRRDLDLESSSSAEVDRLMEEGHRRLALEAEHGRILSIGLLIEDNGELVHRGVLGRDRRTGEFHLDETRTLRSFWKLMSGFNSRCDLLIGHNILDFDLPFICKRSIINSI